MWIEHIGTLIKIDLDVINEITTGGGTTFNKQYHIDCRGNDYFDRIRFDSKEDRDNLYNTIKVALLGA